MNVNGSNLDKLIENSLNFEYLAGKIGPTRPDSYLTNWRILPFWVIARSQKADFYFEIENRFTGKVAAGNVILIPAGARHNVTVKTHDPRVSWAHFRFTILGATDLLALLDLPLVLDRQFGEKFSRLNAALAGLHNKFKNTFDLRMILRKKILGFKLLELLCSAAESGDGVFQAVQRLGPILPSLHFIQTNLDKKIHRLDIARTAHLSPSRFHALFKELTGLAPVSYLKQRRIDHAAKLIAETGLAISQIAEQAGYNDQFHFSRQFKKSIGLSPLAYRKNIKLQLARAHL